jgi:cytochrome c oxidase subunit 1
MIGAYAIFWPMHYLGMAGVPRRYYRFDSFDAFGQFTTMNEFITIAAILVFAAQVLFVINFFWSINNGKKMTTKNPWLANTLEWTTPIHAGHGNWEGNIPTVHRWAYDYGKDGQDYIPQIVPLTEKEKAEGAH